MRAYPIHQEVVQKEQIDQTALSLAATLIHAMAMVTFGNFYVGLLVTPSEQV